MSADKLTMNDRRGKAITFYSYKGGVGRSMALVNIACLAAKENKKILLIDCDLEAPGLHHYFKSDEKIPGFVDLVTDAAEWIKEKANNNEEGYCRFFSHNLDQYIEKNIQPENTEASITIDLMKSGKFDKEYSGKLSEIDWIEFYKKAPAFFRTLAYYLEKDYDYIFIDARTGLADTSGICSMLLPQKLVLLFALNKQNINGVIDVAEQAIEYRFSSNDYRRLDIYPLPSRIENSVTLDLQKWINNYKTKFEKLFQKKYLLDECDLSAYFDRSFIQYYPIHAYGENIPSLVESTGSPNFITYNYNNFLTILKKNISAWEVVSVDEELNNEKLANESVKKGDDKSSRKEYEEAIKDYLKAIELKPDLYEAYYKMGLVNHDLKKYKQAIEDFTYAIELRPDYDLAYSGRSNSKVALGKYDEARSDNLMAIDLSSTESNKKFDLKKFDESLVIKETEKRKAAEKIIDPPPKKKQTEKDKRSSLKILISSSAELKEDRERIIMTIASLNKVHPMLALEPVHWEYDMIKGNSPGYQSIQSAINPVFQESDIYIFIFYSKIGQYTKEEFDYAMKERKPVFIFFKEGFSPRKENLVPYSVLLEFKEDLGDKVLYKDYRNTNELENELYKSLNLYLTENYSAKQIEQTIASKSTTGTEVSALIRLLAEKEEMIYDLTKLSKKDNTHSLERQLDILEAEKEAIRKQLAESKAIIEQQEKDKAALEKSLIAQKKNDEMKAKALEALEKRDYSKAESLLMESAKSNIADTASTFFELANVKKAQLNYKEALSYYELAIKINPENSQYLTDAGLMASDLGFYDKAVEFHEKAIEIDRKFYDEGHPKLSDDLSNLGSAYVIKGDYDKALQYYERALAIDRKSGTADIALSYKNIGFVYDSKKEFNKALEFYEKALIIEEKYYGKMHPNVAMSYNNIASVYVKTGKYDEAIILYERALEIDRKVYGEEHPQTSTRYSNLGWVNKNKGEFDKAIRYYEKGLQIDRKFFGDEHPSIGIRYHNLGLVYFSKGEFDKAVGLFERSLKILEKFYPPSHPTIQSVNDNLRRAKAALTKPSKK